MREEWYYNTLLNCSRPRGGFRMFYSRARKHRICSQIIKEPGSDIDCPGMCRKEKSV